MGNYNLGLSTSSSESSSSYSLNLNYQSLFQGNVLPKPVVVDLPPQERWKLFQAVEKKFQEKKSMVERIESSVTAAVNLDLGDIDPVLIEKIAKSIRTSASNHTKSPGESLDATAIPLGWIGLPDGYSVLVGLDHRDQPKAFGLSVKEFQLSDNMMMKLDFIYDERGSFGGDSQ
ncbi:MAG: hypothetical protein ACI9HK_004317 [Pirellulaceae bacterium]|jgi:hypothetical protein